MAPNAQQVLEAPPGAPTIIRIGEPTPTPQWGQLNDQNVQTWNGQQQNAMQNVQPQPTPLISMSSQPMQSTQMPYSPPGMTQPQQPQSYMPPQQQMQPQAYVPSQPQAQQPQQIAQSMRELRQPAPSTQSAASPSWNTIDFEAMWNRLLPDKYGVLIPMFRSDKKHRDVRVFEQYIPPVIEFLEAWDNVPKNKQPGWYQSALASNGSSLSKITPRSGHHHYLSQERK
eukprot:6490638-Amphidinium_carterae.2